MTLSLVDRAVALTDAAEQLVKDIGDAVDALTLAEVRRLVHDARELKGWAMGIERLLVDYATRPQP